MFFKAKKKNPRYLAVARVFLSILTTLRTIIINTISKDTTQPFFNSTVRNNRYKLQRHLHTLLGSDPEYSRTCKCHQVGRKNVSPCIALSDGQASFRGVARCGDVWLCPICAPSIAARRREQLEVILKASHKEGFSWLFVTFTARHDSSMPLSWLLNGMTKSIRSFKSGRSWQSLKSELGYIDSIGTKEVTYGSSGWHPHQHDLFLVRELLTDQKLFDLEKKLQARWISVLQNHGLSGIPEIALKIQRVDLTSGVKAIADYLPKSGTAADVAMEMQPTNRPYKQGHVTPMELLRLSLDGDKNASRLFVEYAAAFRRKKQIVFGRTILAAYRDYFGHEVGEDLEIVLKEDSKKPDDSIELPRGAIYALYYMGMRRAALEVAERYSLADALAFVVSVISDYDNHCYQRSVEHLQKTGRFRA